MQKTILIFAVIFLSGCFNSSSQTNDNGNKKDVSSVVSSLFEPSAAEKAQAEKNWQTRQQIKKENDQMQKDRLKSYEGMGN